MEVLLVDDQPVGAQVYAAIVRKTFSGARVHTALDLPEALQIAAARKPDVVLLDLALPTASGIEALLRFRRAFPALPIVVVSGSEEKERVQACLAAGAAAYVPKAKALSELAGAIQAALDAAVRKRA